MKRRWKPAAIFWRHERDNMIYPDNLARSDEEVQNAARMLFLGVAPERRDELEGLWEQYQPRFNLVLDAGPDVSFVLDAGRYRDVRFNHRAMRAFWLASFVAWEGYRAFAESSGEVANVDLSAFGEMVRGFENMLLADDPAQVPLPSNVPEPGIYPDKSLDTSARAAAELATIATGWALLHEIRHLQHQQENTGAAHDEPAEKQHAEVLSCDAFATDFILSGVERYAAGENVPIEKVRLKRELGIYFALFAMTLISAGHCGASASHPAMQTRIDGVIRLMGANGTRLSDAIAHVAFAALWGIHADAAGPFRMQPG